MQYGIDIQPYRRVGTRRFDRIVKLNEASAKVIIYLIIAFLLSRVLLEVNPGMGIAPFGIAYILVKGGKSTKEKLFCMLGCSIGYLSMYKSINDILAYELIGIVSFIYLIVKDRFNLKTRGAIAFLLIFSTFLSCNFFFYKQPIGVNLIFSSVKTISIVFVYYVLKYSLNCTDELESNYFFSTEELISIGILVSLLVAGIGNFNLFGISPRNIIAMATVLIIAYISGSGLGAAIGVTMGFIIGISGGNLVNLISLYSVCGLIIGIFKDTGRIFSSISYMVVFLIITVYSNTFTNIGAIEGILAVLILILIPQVIMEQLTKELNEEKKIEIINGFNLNSLKDEFVTRLDNMKSILSSLSVSILNLVENDVLKLNNKGVAMVENLADRACYNCELREKCWDRDLHGTFEGFSELISSCEANDISFPRVLESKCVKKRTLIKNAQEIVNNYTVNEALKTRLSEGRNLIANHMNNMASTVGEMISDFSNDISVCTDIDRILRKTLKKEGVIYNDIFCYLDRKGRMKIKVSLDNCEGANYCGKKIVPAINKLIKSPISISQDGCRINPDSGECYVIVEETPKFHMTSYAATESKQGESLSGDSYSFGRNSDGSYITVVSDGMGSGPEAGKESSVAVDVMEKFINSGFTYNTAVNTINSIMGMKFSEDEKFTTMDINAVDLYTGDCEFIKIGGVVSFIKRGEKIIVIKSDTLPFGILDKVDFGSKKVKLNHGDIIVTISDGILDIDKNNVGSYLWLEDYLENADTNPAALARDVLNEAKRLSGGKVWDDMTVVVSKIYSVF